MQQIMELVNRYRPYINLFTYWGWPIVLLPLVLYPASEILETVGSAAFWLLTFNLYQKPVSILWPQEWPLKKLIQLSMTFRREIGVSVFWFYFFHANGMIRLYGLNPLADFKGFDNFLFWGSLAGTGLTLLVLTSNDRAIRFLKRNWKSLHRLAYPIYYAVLVHADMAHGEFERIWIFGGTFAVLKLAQYLKAKRI